MEKCLPLELLNKMSQKYSSPWDKLEDLRSMNGTELEWDKRCYLPIGGTLALTKENGTPYPQYILDAQILAALFPWRLHKQIYTFDKDMEEMLLSQEMEDLVIPIDILSNLPYRCIYIKVNTLKSIDGFFVHFESDADSGDLELRFLVVNDNLPPAPFIIHLKEGYTIKDGIEETIRVSQKKAEENNITYTQQDKNEFIEEAKSVTCQLIQLVLYICAENKEIEENPEQKKITKKPTNKKYIKDRFREVQKWDLGTKTGMVIRNFNKRTNVNYNFKNNNENYILKESSMKRPHSRRGHWHHFWTGKKETEERKLVLKWVAPTFIHKEIETEFATNNIIKESKKNEK